MVWLVWQVWYGSIVWLVWQVWYGRFGLVGLVLQILFVWFGLVGLVWLGRCDLVQKAWISLVGLVCKVWFGKFGLTGWVFIFRITIHFIPTLCFGDQDTCALCLGTMQDDSTIIVQFKPCYRKLRCLCPMRAILSKPNPNSTNLTYLTQLT